MKSFHRWLAAAAMLCAVVALTACGTTGSLHKPTTAGNAGTTALVAYAVSGATAANYFALSVCATPAVYPCKTQALNDQLKRADTAAYDAAVAADAAGNPAAAQPKIDELTQLVRRPEVKSQVDLAKAQTGGAP